MIFDQFDRIRIINLPHRTDRRQEMERELAKVGLLGNPRVAFYEALKPKAPGVFDSIGAHGVFRSHLRILEEALAVRQSVIVLEDDCRFLPVLRTAKLKNGTDILYGGYTLASDPDDLASADVEGAHCMGFSAAVLEKLVPFLQSILDLRTSFDPQVVRSDFDPAVRPPIDGAYVWFRRYHPEVPTQFAMLADQRPSLSDIAGGKWFDQIPVLRDLASQARRIKSQLS